MPRGCARGEAWATDAYATIRSLNASRSGLGGGFGGGGGDAGEIAAGGAEDDQAADRIDAGFELGVYDGLGCRPVGGGGGGVRRGWGGDFGEGGGKDFLCGAFWKARFWGG